MLANNNLKVCRTLVTRDFKFHPAKNTILILAAMLVTALYTFVFLLGSSVEEGFLLNYQYTYGSTSHILYTGLTDRQADTIAGNANVKSTVRLSTVGQVTDPMIGQRVVKLAVRIGIVCSYHGPAAHTAGGDCTGRVYYGFFRCTSRDRCTSDNPMD